MLDRKIKDVDADIELLLDRMKTNKFYFLLFYLMGWILLLVGIGFSAVNYIFSGVAGIGVGLGLLVIASYFLIIHTSLDSFLFFRRYILKEKEE